MVSRPGIAIGASLVIAVWGFNSGLTVISAAAQPAVERLRKESATREILRQVAPEGPSDGAAKSLPASPPVPAFPTPASPSTAPLEQRVGPPRENAVTRYGQLMTVRGQQLTQEVNNAVVDARKIGADDPDAGILALKARKAP